MPMGHSSGNIAAQNTPDSEQKQFPAKAFIQSLPDGVVNLQWFFYADSLL